MKALFGGCFSFIAIIFALTLCLQYPWLFWAVLGFFAFAVMLGIRNGRKQLQQKSSNQITNTKPAKNSPRGPSDDEEGDIRHHYNYGGTPMSIDNPGTIQNQSMSFGSDDEDEAER